MFAIKLRISSLVFDMNFENFLEEKCYQKRKDRGRGAKLPIMAVLSACRGTNYFASCYLRKTY